LSTLKKKIGLSRRAVLEEEYKLEHPEAEKAEEAKLRKTLRLKRKARAKT
jgi:hypothetical protein